MIATANTAPLEVLGYPSVVILVVLGVGIPLVFLRPYAAFLFATFLITAADAAMFNKTRTAMLGPFLNLADTCVLLALLALLLEKYHTKEPFRLPQIIVLMLLVLTLGVTQSLWRFGFTHNTMASVRYALDVPLAYLLGANFVTSTARARKLIGVLLCGALAAAVQHVMFVATLWRSKGPSMESYHLIRTITFWAGCMSSAFLLSGIFWKTPAGTAKKALYAAAALLFLATLLLNQTRSLWIATAAAVPVLVLTLRQGRWLRMFLRLAAACIVITASFIALCQRLLPGLDVGELAGGRITSLAAADAKISGVDTRKRAFRIEMRDWFAGTLVLGRGLGFFQKYPEALNRNPLETVAFGHLGYVTYLSQLGLIGLLVYGLCLPLGVFRNGLWLWRYTEPEVLRYLGLLGIASIVCLSIMFVMSSQFLGLGSFAPGVLYGAVWAAVRGQEMESPAGVVSDDEGFTETAPDGLGLNGQML
jgi:hypothetical protein